MAEFTKTGENTVTITVEVPPPEVRARVAATFAKLSRTVKYPGFRKGKVPRHILERTYSDQVLQEVVDELVPDAFDAACAELGLEPLGMPKYRVSSASLEGPVAFTAETAVFPDVDLPDYSKFIVKRERPKVTDAEVAQALESLRQVNARLEPVTERGALDGEMVILKFREAKAPEGFSGKPIGVWASVRDDELFGKQVVGKRPGDAFDLRVQYPADYPDKAHRGKTVEAPVEVLEIKKPVPPELGDDFAKDMGEETLAALKKRLQARLEERADELSYVNAYHRLLDDVAARAKVPLSASFLDDFIQPGPDEPAPDAKGREERLAAARRDLTRYFLVRAIARREGVTVAAEEVRAAIEAANASGEAPESPSLIFDRILNEKLARKLIPREEKAGVIATSPGVIVDGK